MSSDSEVSLTLDEVKTITQKTLETLIDKWQSMYVVTNEIKSQRFSQFVSHLNDFYHEMLQSEENRKVFYMKEVEKKLKECRDLEKALNVTIRYDDMDCSQTPLTETLKYLDNSLKSFEEVKMQRMNKLNTLREKEGGICKILGMKEMHISSSIPSEDDINRLEHHIFILEEEHFKRIEQFQNYRENIIEYIQKLEISTLLDFEKTLVDSESATSLTNEDIERVKDMEGSYKKQFDLAKVKVEYMFGELKKLWSLLDIDQDYQMNFLEKYTGVGRKTMDHIQKEIHRCEKLKQELIEPLVKKTRSQIRNLCEKLCYTSEQSEKYLFNNNHCSGDLLDILEIELGKLDIVYNKNSEILEVAKKQRNMWDRKLELEEAAKDKNRLFNNRGGQLLREEKERKTIEQALPKLNKKLEDMLIDYEERNGTPFLYYGKNLLLQVRDDIEQACNRPNKPIKKNEPKITDSASKLREKRKLNNGLLTPKSENRKRLKLTGSTTSIYSSASKHSNKSVDGKCESRSRVALFHDQDTSVASTYSLFQEEIEEKKRSATMCNPDRPPLKDVNSPVIPFLSSPSQDNTPRFNFRPRGNCFMASSKSNQSSSVKKIATPRVMTRTPGKSKHAFATPDHMARSVSRLATPKQISCNRPYTPGANNHSRNYALTPKSDKFNYSKNASAMKPSKFKFDF